MAFIGTPLDTRNTFQSLVGKRFNGDGSTTDFTLDVAPGSTLDIEVFVGNVRQDPNSAYTVSGTTLSFTGAPPSGTNNIYVVHQAKSVGTITPSANSVGVTELNLSDGSNGQFIKTDGSGTLSFATVDTSSATDSFSITGSTPTLTIGDAGAEDTKIVFDGNAQDYHVGLDDSSDDFIIGLGSTLGTTSYLNIDESGKLSTGGETAPETSAGGITLNQAGADTHIFSCKSSDIAHGMTSLAETDTFFGVKKYNASTGGVRAEFYGEAEIGAVIDARVTNGNSNTDTGATAGVMCKNSKKSSTTVGSHGNDDNMLVVTNADNAKFIVKGDGDIYYDGADQGAYDSYDDAHMVRAFDLSHGNGTIDSKFDKFVAYNHEKLAELKLVGRQKDGTPNHFVNITGMQRLHNGAIWQQYEKHNQLLEAVYDLAKEAVGEEKANAILEKHEVKRLQ